MSAVVEKPIAAAKKANDAAVKASATADPTPSATADPTPSATQPAAWPILAAAGLLVAALFGATFVELVRIWEIDPNYSHGYAVPVLSLIIAVLAFNAEGGPIRAHVSRLATYTGLLLMVAGAGLQILAWFAGFLLVSVVALILVLRGLLLVLGGRHADKAFGFAAFFLIFMAPLPAAWYQPIAITLQEFVAGISAVELDAVGIPTLRNGYIIEIPGYTMEVGAACSGMRQLTAIVALAFAVGYFSQRGLVYRAVLVALSIPIAVGVNCLRVFATGVIMHQFGKQYAEGVWHESAGWVLIAVAAVINIGIAFVLAWSSDMLGRKKDRRP